MKEYEVIFDMLKGQYDFRIDLRNNRLHEEWAEKYVVNKGLAKTAELVDSTDKVERKVRDLILHSPDNSIELKRNILCFTYGNVYIEIESDTAGSYTFASDSFFRWRLNGVLMEKVLVILIMN